MKPVYLLLLLFIPFAAFPQTGEELKIRRGGILEKVQKTERLLAGNREEQSKSMGRLYALKQQMKQHEMLAKTLRSEIAYLESEIRESTAASARLSRDLGKYKLEYASMVYAASKAGDNIKKLSFLFSSESVNQLFARLKYFEQYAEVRKKYLGQISELNQSLIEISETSAETRVEKKQLLTSLQAEYRRLSDFGKEQDSLVNFLLTKEKELLIRVETDKNSSDKMEEVALEEIDSTLAAPPKTEAIVDEEKPEKLQTPIGELKGPGFAKNKGHLHWPVGEGFVSLPFGTRNHPVLKDVTIENLGVEIRTSEDAEIRAVFEGTVLAVKDVPNRGKMVMIRHDDNYFTVYTRLHSPKVVAGEEVPVGTTLGYTMQNEDGFYEVLFQVWHNMQKLDPEKWLRSR